MSGTIGDMREAGHGLTWSRRVRTMRRRVAVALVVVMTLSFGGTSAVADVDPPDYAPVDRPGSPLQVPRAALDASLSCAADLAGVDREVVLLLPGTGFDPDEIYSWNYQPALSAHDIPYCSLTVPHHTLGDIQIAAEYVVDAVRTIHAATGRKVILLGGSQGGSTLPRWALRFWPGIRPMVASLIGGVPANNRGLIIANGVCLLGCPPAVWQHTVGSEFIAALNSHQQTFEGIAYTMVYSRYDEFVFPNLDGSLSVLPEGPNVTNVAISDVCPTDVSGHVLITTAASPTAWAVALDAIEHPGQPADLDRVDVPVPCLPGTMPGVRPLELVVHELALLAKIGPRLLTGRVDAEPPLACYVTASCP